MKKTIKLNEQQLRKIVYESLNAMLTELDWKTYMNASKKTPINREDSLRRKQDILRRNRFVDAAQDQFFKDYGYENPDERAYHEWGKRSPNVKANLYLNRIEASSQKDDSSPSHRLYHQRDKDGKTQNIDIYRIDQPSGDRWDMRDRYDRTINPDLDRFFGTDEEDPSDKEAVKSFKRASKELDDYNDDNYTYQKGQGWKKK